MPPPPLNPGGAPSRFTDTVRVREADLDDPDDAHGILEVLDSYASDDMGIRQPLAADIRERIVSGLRDYPTTLVLLAIFDKQIVGVAVCFFGFSTFRARPLLNIHDLAVLPDFRGRGIGQSLLSEIENRARQRDCCKLTLEVRTDNDGARRLYERFGFEASGGTDLHMLFLAKPLATAEPSA